jgi:hypothetical protein
MPRDGRQRDGERFREIRHANLPVRKPLEQPATGGVGESRERIIERRRFIFNHIVKYNGTSAEASEKLKKVFGPSRDATDLTPPLP